MRVIELHSHTFNTQSDTERLASASLFVLPEGHSLSTYLAVLLAWG